MRKQGLRKWMFWLLATVLLVPILLFFVVVVVLYLKQDDFVQYGLTHANQDLKGQLKIRDSHIAPFQNFPLISIDLEDLEIYESKDKNADRLVHINDAYIGFNLWEILRGDVKVHKITLKKGSLDLKQHPDGTINVANALAPTIPSNEVSEDLHLDLDAVELVQVDVNKLNEVTHLKIDLFMNRALASFRSNDKGIDFTLDSDFYLSVLNGKDSTFFRHKHVHFDTDFQFSKADQRLRFDETTVEFEKTLLDFQGHVLFNKDLEVDVDVRGHKPNFNLFFAFAPQDVSAAMSQFDNQGKVYFQAKIQGKTANGHQPAIEAKFGCSEGMLENPSTHKKIKAIGFEGYFTNGEKRNASTMFFSVKRFKMKPQLGDFRADISVKNFAEPEIDMKVNADLDLDFLARFSTARAIQGMEGKVELAMNFHDIVDFNHPEHTLKNLNQAYYSRLKVTNFSAKLEGLPFPIQRLNIDAEADGRALSVRNFGIKYGKSDLDFSGSFSDLPALIHHTDIPVRMDFALRSKHLDFRELTRDQHGKPGFDESLNQLKLKGSFLTSARNITESPNLPQGEFVISEAFGKLEHYPHAFHDLHLDLLIDDLDLTLKDFRGAVDHSDFQASGIFHHYDFWFKPQLDGMGEVQLALSAKHLIFKELFSYRGTNHLPKEYREEELSNFHFKGHANALFHHGVFTHGQLQLDKLSGKLKSHPLALHHFSGKLDYAKDLISFQHVKGAIGNSDFDLNGSYHLSQQKHRSQLQLKSKTLDLDALFPTQEEEVLHGSEHDTVASLYDYVFPNLDLKVDIGHFTMAPYDLREVHFDAQVFNDHHIDLHHFKVLTAEGSLSGSGTFSGRDKNHIYFAPNFTIHHLNLDKFMVKFDNFGQDHVVSENLHGYAEGTLKGKIHLHADFIPKLDDSDLEINLQVTNGRLENYAPLSDLGSYFEDKDVTNVKFDTLTNVFRLKGGKLSIPEMVICSSLGFLKIAGEQSISGKMPMEYQIGIPWSMIKEVAKNKLFKNKQKGGANEDDVVAEEKNAKYLYFKVAGDLENYSVTMVKKKGK
ncbi:MAG: hypothetical protein EBU82_11140 [Flavobacteriia bacterium]|nr:hypothetical protein [Flavobacteriia bacterium]